MKTSYMQRGSGKDLVFLHGYGASKECFLPQINYFSKFYRVTALDFWGFGQSEDIPASWSVGEYARQTGEFFKEVGIVRPIVVAHSFGARVAVKMAGEKIDENGARGKKAEIGENAERAFEKLIITGGAGIILPKNRGIGYKIKVTAYRMIKRLFPNFAERHFGSKEYRKLPPIMRESYKKIVNEDLREVARGIACPTLLIYGDGDTTTPIAEGEVYRSVIQDCEMKVMKNCGHFAFLDDSKLFTMIVEEFLEK